MVNNKLQEKFDFHAQDNKSDMYYHFSMLAGIAKNSDYIIEFGVRSIVSTWALLYGLANSNSRFIHHENFRTLTMKSIKKLISYDVNDPSNYGGNIDEVYEIAKEHDINYEFKKGSTLDIEIDECHSIFFDTEHTYDQLSQELKLHGNKAMRYLIFHDTTEQAKELIPAINEFLEENSKWAILRIENMCHGLIVLAKRDISDIKAAWNHWEQASKK